MIPFKFYFFCFTTVPSYAWNLYLNALDVLLKGVLAGPNLYVGGGVDSSGQTVPATLESGKCYSFLGLILNNCVYLANQPNNFEWLASKNGDLEAGQVVYGGIPMGRVLYNGIWRMGRISNSLKALVYAFGGKELTANKYEALIFKPLSVVLQTTTTKAPTSKLRPKSSQVLDK